MKVIFIKDVPNVGKKYEVRQVKDGFARNFLFRQNLALPATSSNVKRVDSLKAEEEKRIAEKRQKFELLAQKLKQMRLEFKLKAGKENQVFGSVTKSDLLKELKEKGIELEKDWIELDEHIKSTGQKDIAVKFPYGVEGKLVISIEAEK